MSVYLCGATVQAPPHIGHLRSAVCFDILVRWLEACGYQVTFCRNVTDIEDKILRTAERDGVPLVGCSPSVTSARSPGPTTRSAAAAAISSRARPGTSRK